ncbi:Defensin-like protein 173 [Arabidopsis thaliana]|uniref:Defensin-like protein 173 n=3 Tax=Arabidopsis TaxID=3701 RepID=DF173_ARATH|nr:low-molecular-weight cysteine-rich 63 [Arabidopsis thaliana]P82777.1 RecName: Full=Defensin-like protein 173; AltName: Full=Low-molecular-weight cysteine-rich protein 63; Short=Protein LCR63; Flags: Precursor [Arabidopsis thaliana]AEE85715.1 low-molecular-weight cysteine-rich 63 [Arabidopsis thaliana]KAG7617852.1 hypothetical protein ISN45_At04g031840 [Arabidopsis thaliana x Arabidopsis arenosa]CAA0396979.1 unnamed protein product [Arabidopsis thaliana]|eukprot:NP_001031754.1 low-molecular-weight cysteine-rich 63 [Arabidopsis thaliana]
MAKAPSPLVFPIIFLIIFALVEPNMGCIQIIGRCIKIPDCSASCRKFLGPHASGYCDNDGAGGTCICTYPCQTKEIHM